MELVESQDSNALIAVYPNTIGDVEILVTRRGPVTVKLTDPIQLLGALFVTIHCGRQYCIVPVDLFLRTLSLADSVLADLSAPPVRGVDVNVMPAVDNLWIPVHEQDRIIFEAAGLLFHPRWNVAVINIRRIDAVKCMGSLCLVAR